MVMTTQPESTVSAQRRRSFTWLQRPERLTTRRRRRHLLVLGLLIAFGLARGVYSSVAMPVFSPIDEMAHFGYVKFFAEGHGIPVIGRDLVSNDIIVAAKHSPTSNYRDEPFQPTRTDANWGPVRQQYEATVAPTYYGLMALPYWMGHPWGLTGELFAVRLATAMLALVAVPITWAMARRMFPRHPTVWLVAPTFLVVVSSLAFGSVTNDAMAVVLAAAAVLTLMRALDDAPARGWVVVAGVVFGLGLVTKATSLMVVPILAVIVIGWWLSARPGWARATRAVGTYGAAVVVVVLPWLVWNIANYHSTSGNEALNRVFKFKAVPLTWSSFATDVRLTRVGLFASQVLRAERYTAFWLVLLAALVVAALIVAAMRRTWDDLLGVAVCAAVLPAALIVDEFVKVVLVESTFSLLGRHLLPILPFVMIALAGALGVVVTRRWLPVAAGVIVTGALLLESRAAVDLLNRAYERTVHDQALAPVVDQSWSDKIVATPSIRVSPTCPVDAFQVAFAGTAPAQLTVHSGDRSWTVPALPTSTSLPLYSSPTPDTSWYRLPTALAEPFTIELPPAPLINSSTDDRTPALAMTGRAGDPVARLYCRRSDPRELAFAAAYAPNHPDWPNRDLLRDLPYVAVGLAALATAAAAVAALRPRRRPRNVTREDSVARGA